MVGKYRSFASAVYLFMGLIMGKNDEVAWMDVTIELEILISHLIARSHGMSLR